MIESEFFDEEDLADLIESTFDTCINNKDEFLWLIAMIKGLLNIHIDCTTTNKDNVRLKYFQYRLHPIIESYKKRWGHSNYGSKSRKFFWLK